MKLTNNTNSTLEFVTGSRDGEAVTEALRPGETRTIAGIKSDDKVLAARLFVGAVRVADTSSKASRKAAAPVSAEA